MTCSINGCGRKPFAMGLCSRHYYRNRKYGAPDGKPKEKPSFSERLWKFIEKSGTEECWPWIGKSKVHGYGIIGLPGKHGGTMLAHRAVWIESNGPLPEYTHKDGIVIRHACDNRACCNPAHLLLGTQADNVHDMDERGRRVIRVLAGADHYNAKITEAQVREIRASYESNKVLAVRYGFKDWRAVKNIKLRRSWNSLQ